MSFDPSIAYYKNMVMTRQLPYPYHYPYLTLVPNLTNQTNNIYINALDNCYYGYEGAKMYDRINNRCHNPNHSTSNNVSYNYNPHLDKYDYYFYNPYPVQDPSFILGFLTDTLVSNIPKAPLVIVETTAPIIPKFAAPKIPAVTPLKLPTFTPPVGPVIQPFPNIQLAKNYDPNLLDPWGILIANDIIWIANVGSGFVTRYDLLGRPVAPPINVFGPLSNIAQPTSIVYNPNQLGFMICRDRLSFSSTMIIATRNGTINAYNENIDALNSVLMINNSNCVYTGMVLVCDTLYVTDFFNKKIDVFDLNFVQITTIPFIDGDDTDPIPLDYSPINVSFLGNHLYVSYAKQDVRNPQFEIAGCGHGYISVYDLNGTFVKRFHSRGVLNIPWSIIYAPSIFGYPAGAIMISNFGDGVINIFGPCGKYLSTLSDSSGNAIYLNGLHGITVNPSYEKYLHWTAKPLDGSDDSFVGSIVCRNVN